jgi:hypothetical protein
LNKLVPAMPERKEKLHAWNIRTLRTMHTISWPTITLKISQPKKKENGEEKVLKF